MKKFLSLVLALVMTMSLVTISAGAEDFTDDSTITYAEAVDVMSAVGVVGGYADGSFNPTAGLSRGAAAKIICNMILGPTTAAALSADTAPYKDVAIDNTYAGYIAYCAQQGIISGYADGTFRPYAPLTGYAFMKMLLGALGYDASVEGYTGANWSINVAKRALNLGLDSGLEGTFVGTKALTREEACLYAFNTMKADMVQYDTTITIGDVVVAGSKAEEVANTGKTDGNIENDDVMQFAEKYFTKLNGREVRDDFGRPATEWKVGTSKVGTYVWEADLTYTAGVEKGDIYADLGLSKANVTDEYAINGKDTADITLSKGDETKIGANGVLTQVWYDDDADELIITHIYTYVGKIGSVTKATSTVDRYVIVSAYIKVPGTLNTKFETEEFAAKDLITYTAAWNASTSKYDIKTVELLEDAATGTLTEWNGKTYDVPGSTGKSENNFTVDGVTYKYSADYIVVDENGSETNVWNFEVDEAELNVYVDEYGYAIYVDGVEAEKNYAAVIGIGKVNQYGSETRGVTLLLPDGTKKEVTAKLPSAPATLLSKPDGSTYESNLVKEGWADLVTYSIDDDGVYKLSVVGGYDNGALSGASAQFVNGKSLFNLDGSTYYTTSETVFMVATDDGKGGIDYNVYTGYANMPSIDSIVGIKGYAIETNSDYTTQVDVVYIYAARMAGISDVDTYFVKKQDADIITNSNGSYYVLPAIVEGEETSVMVDAAAFHAIAGGTNNTEYGLYAINNVTKNSKDIITNFGIVNGTVFNAGNPATGTVAANKVVLGINGGKTTATYWAYNDDTAVYVVDKDYKTITVSSVSAVATDANDKVFASYDTNNKVLVDVVIVEQPVDAYVEPVVPTVPESNATIIGNEYIVAPGVTGIAAANAVSNALKEAGYTDVNIVVDASGTMTKVEAKINGITVTFNPNTTAATAPGTWFVIFDNRATTGRLGYDIKVDVDSLDAGAVTVVLYKGDAPLASTTKIKGASAVNGFVNFTGGFYAGAHEPDNWTAGHQMIGDELQNATKVELYINDVLVASKDL